MAEIAVTEFTDPACPWAWSAEPFRRRLQWTYGDALSWERRMVVLATSGQEYLDKGFTPDMLTGALEAIARDHGMPIDVHPRERMSGTELACRSVVGARTHAPEREEALLRALRLRTFAGEHLDEASTVRHAAGDSSLDADALLRWMESDAVRSAVAEDMRAARHPTPAALAQDDCLAGWEEGRRYTCPSLELVRTRDGAQLSVPGFQPYESYEVAVANLLPEATRRPAPESVADVLAWAGEPLATREVAEVCRLSDADAREALTAVATETRLGTDGLWSLP